MYNVHMRLIKMGSDYGIRNTDFEKKDGINILIDLLKAKFFYI